MVRPPNVGRITWAIARVWAYFAMPVDDPRPAYLRWLIRLLLFLIALLVIGQFYPGVKRWL